MLQRLAPLGLMAALVGGGWSMLGGVVPDDVRRVAGAVGAAVQQRVATPANYGAAGGYAQGAPPQSGYAPRAPGMPTPQAGPPAGNQAAWQGGGAATIRIASFNIQTFGTSKAKKAYVMNTLADLVRRFDVIAIQEIRTSDDYFVENFLRYYVNADGRSRYATTVSRRLGRTVSTERYAFIYNTATIEANPQVDFVLDDPEDRLHREPHVAMFRTRLAPPNQAFTFILMNVHTDPHEAPQELDALAGAYEAVQRMTINGAPEDDVILLGDLNTNVPMASAYRPAAGGRSLAPADLHGLGRVRGVYPLVRDAATNTRGSRLHDNLVISRIATTEFTGASGVYDYRAAYGLNESQALEVSDHFPVWGEFSAYESTQLGRVATRR